MTTACAVGLCPLQPLTELSIKHCNKRRMWWWGDACACCSACDVLQRSQCMSWKHGTGERKPTVGYSGTHHSGAVDIQAESIVCPPSVTMAIWWVINVILRVWKTVEMAQFYSSAHTMLDSLVAHIFCSGASLVDVLCKTQLAVKSTENRQCWNEEASLCLPPYTYCFASHLKNTHTHTTSAASSGSKLQSLRLISQKYCEI